MPRDVGPSVMPPQMLHPVDGVDERTALASGMCPLCAQSRVNPTACVRYFFIFFYNSVCPSCLSIMPLIFSIILLTDLVEAVPSVYHVLFSQLTSGYLFCYLCIVPHVQTSGKCPITLAPTGVDDLIRVYDHDDLIS